MAEFYQKTKDRLKILAISINRDDSAEELAVYCREQNIEYTVLMDEGFRVTTAYGIRYTPTYIIVDRSGRINYVGSLAPEELDRYLK